MYGWCVNGEWVWGVPSVSADDVWEILERWMEDVDED